MEGELSCAVSPVLSPGGRTGAKPEPEPESESELVPAETELRKELGRGEPQLQDDEELESEGGEAGAGGGELQRFFCYLSVLPLVSVPVSLFVLGLPLWGVVLAALAVLFGVFHNRVWLCVRAYLPAYAAEGALAPLLVETIPVSDPRSSHCYYFFRDSGRVLVFPGGARCHSTAVWVVVSMFVCLPAWLWYPP